MRMSKRRHSYVRMPKRRHSYVRMSKRRHSYVRMSKRRHSYVRMSKRRHSHISIHTNTQILIEAYIPMHKHNAHASTHLDTTHAQFRNEQELVGDVKLYASMTKM